MEDPSVKLEIESSTGRLESQYASPLGLLLSSFVIVQTLFGCVVSLGGPMLVFWLMFRDEPYNRLGGELVSNILLSPFLCALLSLALAPLSMPEAVEGGIFFVVRSSSAAPLARWLPFLRSDGVWKFGAARHLAIGFLCELVAAPPALLVARYGLPELVTSWEVIWFSVTYIALLPIVCVPLGLLAFAVEPNYVRVEEMMSNDPMPARRLFQRLVWSPLC